MTTRSLIGKLIVRSCKHFLVWGDVRGMVAEVDTYEQAAQELADDWAGCLKQGGYSDAHIYQDDGYGHWEVA